MSQDHKRNEFLVTHYPDLYKQPEVAKLARRKADGENLPESSVGREERIDLYMQRLEKLFVQPSEKKRKRNIRIIQESLLSQVIIQAENFPDSYLLLQQRIQEQRGLGHIPITQEMKADALEIVQEDQSASFMEWVNYLSSEEDPYPPWFKYYALRSVSSLQTFNIEKNKFRKRDKKTTANFPELNKEALSRVYDLFSADENDLSAKDLELVRKRNFAKLYGREFGRIRTSILERDESLEEIDGKWQEFDKNSIDELTESLQGKGTGWCIAGKKMANKYLDRGKLHVFYSKDADGDYSVPRIVITTKNGYVDEVRGLEPGQNIEQDLIDTAIQRFELMPGGDRYLAKARDMKRVTELKDRIDKGEELSQDDLVFLYEITKPIESFGYDKDPRIGEIVKTRDVDADLEIATKVLDEILQKTEEGTPLSKDEIGIVYGLSDRLRTDYRDRQINFEDNLHILNDAKDMLNHKIIEILKLRNEKQDMAVLHDLDQRQIADRLSELDDETVVYIGPLTLQTNESIPNSLKIVRGNLILSNPNIIDTGTVELIAGDLIALLPSFSSFGILKTIMGDLDVRRAGLLFDDIPDELEIRGYIDAADELED